MNSASFEPSVPHSTSEDAALARLLEEYLTALTHLRFVEIAANSRPLDNETMSASFNREC